jgi:signal transduction histidine kinase
MKTNASLTKRDLDPGIVSKHDFLQPSQPLANSEAIWQELVNQGYITNEGIITSKFDPESRRFKLVLSEEFAPNYDLIYKALFKRFKEKDVMTFINSTTQNIQRILNIAEVMLQYGKTKTGEKQSVSIPKIFQDVIILVEGDCKKRGIQIQFIPPENLPPVMGDDGQINQAVLNIVINATQAMQNNDPDKPKILTLSCQEAVFVDINGLENKGIELSITDTGCGISEENISKIYEPFFSTKSKTGAQNVGLGLSILEQIIKDHAGNIVVQSQLNKGTTFKLYFPLSQPSTETINKA